MSMGSHFFYKVCKLACLTGQAKCRYDQPFFTITTCAGLMPIIVERSVQAQYLIPMAVTLSSGVFVASFLTLILVPCLLVILNDCRVGFAALWHLRIPSREEVEPGSKRREIDGWIKEI